MLAGNIDGDNWAGPLEGDDNNGLVTVLMPTLWIAWIKLAVTSILLSVAAEEKLCTPSVSVADIE